MENYNKLISAIVAGIVLLIVVLLVFGGKIFDKNMSSSTITPSVSFNPVQNSGVKYLPEDNVVWLDEPKEVYDLDLFGKYEYGDGQSYDSHVDYYWVGNDGDKKIYLAVLVPDEIGESIVYLLTDGELIGQYDLLMVNSSIYSETDTVVDYHGPKLYDSVTIKQKVGYKSLLVPSDIEISGNKYSQIYSYRVIINNYKETSPLHDSKPNFSLDFLFDSSYGKLYKYKVAVPDYYSKNNDSLYSLFHVVLKLKDGVTKSYVEDFYFLSDDQVANITWKDGIKNTDSYRYDGGGGCGGGGSLAIANGDIESSLQIAGVTSRGEKVYEFKGTTSKLFKLFYLSTGGMYYEYDSKTGESFSGELTENDYLKNHGIFFYKNNFGDYVIFLNTKYGPQAECGKPVIYLYPTETTDVSVKVDANITKSEPVYPVNGWNVKANPDGSLIYKDGSIYPYLFWEGTGHEYPIIQKGFVVKQKNIELTLRDHLGRLGLNENETNDFLEFWLPLMPKTPYIRLSWLGTQDMNRLAPLEISPKPDSVIRVFLDFQGLEKEIKIPEQKLSSIPRNGFTVIEWGGLLKK